MVPLNEETLHARLHTIYTGELQAMEAAGRTLFDFPDAPWEFNSIAKTSSVAIADSSWPGFNTNAVPWANAVRGPEAPRASDWVLQRS